MRMAEKRRVSRRGAGFMGRLGMGVIVNGF
jgi:hypothetical protein